MRGLRRGLQQRAHSKRITPACAGTTKRCSAQGRGYRDHPRMCGDYHSRGLRGKELVGSPPHVRGLPDLSIFAAPTLRITPACAGTTARCGGKKGGHGDHPRMCGDYRTHPFSAWPSPGSPPHVRGLHSRQRDGKVSLRITPACAGTTRQTAAG